VSSDPASPGELFQLDEATCLALLTTQHVGRFVVGGADPTVVPVNYQLVDGAITDTWAPGVRDRCITVTCDVVTGRLLRGALDSSSDRVGGYL
jgi:hypothetical protein